MFEIITFTALPYLFATLTNVMVNKLIMKSEGLATTDDVSKSSVLSKFSRILVGVGLVFQIFSFLLQTQQNPTGWL
jgi:hypothetical protein